MQLTNKISASKVHAVIHFRQNPLKTFFTKLVANEKATLTPLLVAFYLKFTTAVKFKSVTQTSLITFLLSARAVNCFVKFP